MTTQETISFTLRGVSQDLDKNLSAIAFMEGKSRNQLILDILNKEFSDHIANYARKNQLVKAMDGEICQKIGFTLSEKWYENEHIIILNKKLGRFLSINSESDVDEIFKNNIALIEFRAQQLWRREEYKKLPLGISLTFALFIQIARMDRNIIEEIKREIFYYTESYMDDINEIRTEIGLPVL